ncbi:scamp family-domain-containing protein [Zychaea mexicana]|uniref:scamp family-domain-containing protein n=1 Tax=Zychaea mexicana TaxID=64656 RepID=UPI0022FE1D27|nr:scamp family-domain-containing protein [Zychaea mexicana]KAI9493981.1 scamp family-domain-containing protein [Zychaea mexicana]
MAHHQASPFDDPSNPFQDPTITSALTSNNQDSAFALEQDPLHDRRNDDDEFTTFRQYPDNNQDPFSSVHDQKTLVDSQEQQVIGGSSSSNSKRGDGSNGDLNAREEALRQKERELAEREANLQERRRPHANNFPPCFPIMYLDITTEIPLNHQSTVWWLYREWLWFELTLVWNFVACLCLLFSHPESVTSAPTDLGISLTEMFTHTLASFFLWYRPVYNAYMKEVSLYYTMYFIFNGFHILYTIYKAVGIPNTGGAGLILVVALFTDGYIVTGVIALLAAICWIGMGCLAIYLYKKTYDHYKAAGHTFKEAKDDAYGRIGRSSNARDAAISMAWNSHR